MLTPSKAWLPKESLRKIVDDADKALDQEVATGRSPAAALDRLSFAAREGTSPLERLEHGLHPWVGFVIMPIFALANSGVPISAESLSSGLAIAIAVALVIGKPLGIVGAAWIAIKTKKASLPDGVGWGALWGAGFLCGIGFTMSLFITSLSFSGELGDAARMGVMLGSAISLIIGMSMLVKYLPKPGGMNPHVALFQSADRPQKLTCGAILTRRPGGRLRSNGATGELLRLDRRTELMQHPGEPYSAKAITSVRRLKLGKVSPKAPLGANADVTDPLRFEGVFDKGLLAPAFRCGLAPPGLKSSPSPEIDSS